MRGLKFFLVLPFLFTLCCKQDSTEPVWKIRLKSRSYADPLLRHGKFYVFSQAGEVVSGDARTGKRNWTKKVAGPVLGTPVFSEESLFLATQDGFVYALNSENGNQKWQMRLNDLFIAPLAILPGALLVPSENGTLYALGQENGTEKWRFSGQKKFNASPAVVGNSILIGGWSKQFTSLKMDGSVNWKLTTAQIITGDPLVLGNSVFFPCYDQFVYAVEIPTGRLLWRFPIRHPSNLVILNKEIVFASDTDLLYVSPNSGKLLRRMKLGKIVSRIYADNSSLFVVARNAYRVSPLDARLSEMIHAPNPIFKLSFGVGMILASDDLYSIYGYGNRKN